MLDEFTYPMKWGWVDVDEVVADPGARGRATSTSSSPAATPTRALLEAADLVTEMSKVKHPMDAGQKGQKGIEW